MLELSTFVLDDAKKDFKTGLIKLPIYLGIISSDRVARIQRSDDNQTLYYGRPPL